MKLYKDFEEWYYAKANPILCSEPSRKELMQEAYVAGQENCHCKIREAKFDDALEAVYQEIMAMPEGEWLKKIEAEAFKYITPDEHWWLGK